MKAHLHVIQRPAALIAAALTLACAAGCAPVRTTSRSVAQDITVTPQGHLEAARRDGRYAPGAATQLPPGVLRLPSTRTRSLSMDWDDPVQPGGQPFVREEDGSRTELLQLEASHINAGVHTVAQRRGAVELVFDVVVPKDALGDEQRLSLVPWMHLLGEDSPLGAVVLSGEKFRKAQLRGYERYNRFLSSIVTDTTRFLDLPQLEVFLQRNLPQVYAYRRDSSFVTDEQFRSSFGVNGPEAVDHYTYWYRVRRNQRRIAARDKMFRRFVPTPYLDGGLRVDTVLYDPHRGFVYRYTQTLGVSSGLKRVDITLRGERTRFESSSQQLAGCDTLSFHISSLASLMRDSTRYLPETLPRTDVRHAVCSLQFALGRWDVDPSLGSNARELGRIAAQQEALAKEQGVVVDSIVVTASCSPEGGYNSNRTLGGKRSFSVMRHFEGAFPVKVSSRCDPENWTRLDELVREDPVLGKSEKTTYEFIRTILDPDRREAALARTPFYEDIRQRLYPQLRTVRFDFHLHSVHDEQVASPHSRPDPVYEDGLSALRDRDFAQAASLLEPYRDYNTALSYAGADRDTEALEILSTLPPEGDVRYLQALLMSRGGALRKARELYMEACFMDGRFLQRGYLDPEILPLREELDALQALGR